MIGDPRSEESKHLLWKLTWRSSEFWKDKIYSTCCPSAKLHMGVVYDYILDCICICNHVYRDVIMCISRLHSINSKYFKGKPPCQLTISQLPTIRRSMVSASRIWNRLSVKPSRPEIAIAWNSPRNERFNGNNQLFKFYTLDCPSLCGGAYRISLPQMPLGELQLQWMTGRVWIHGAVIYGNMDPINIPQMLAYHTWILWPI